MTIHDYYSTYKDNIKFAGLGKGEAKTIDDLYCKVVEPMQLPYGNALAWHQMLLEYSKRDDAIFWIRFYENGQNGVKPINNRRACLTRFPDGFCYVFVSNFDPQEIWNMVRLGVTPDIDEFHDLMRSLSYPFHYCPSPKTEESEIKAFPRIGDYRHSLLTARRYYFAHVVGVADAPYILPSGTTLMVQARNQIGQKLFPRGKKEDWKDIGAGKKCRELHYCLTDEEKLLVRAHFLRFVSPLNYYLTPSEKCQVGKVNNIGRYSNMNDYVYHKNVVRFGKALMDEFCKEALCVAPSLPNGKEIIDLRYDPKGLEALAGNRSVSSPAPTKKLNPRGTRSGAISVSRQAKAIFQGLLEKGKLSDKLIQELLVLSYCKKEFGLSYAVLTEAESGFVKKDYYTSEPPLVGRYYFTCQWKQKQLDRIDPWLKANGLD